MGNFHLIYKKIANLSPKSERTKPIQGNTQ